MTLPAVLNPFDGYLGLTGAGLNGGSLYIGVAGSDPQSSPQACYWDAAGTIPASQPIPISGGYPMRSGSPAVIYTATTFSMRLRDAQGVQVFYVASTGTASYPAVIQQLLACTTIDSIRSLLEIPSSIFAATGLTVGTSGAAAANSAAVNAQMAAISALGGGQLVLPAGAVYIGPTLDNKYPHVLVTGASGDIFHDSGSSVVATRLIATQAGWMAKLRTPYAAEQGIPVANTFRNSGGGFKNLSFDGAAVATGFLQVDTVACVDVDVYATNGNAPLFFQVKCGIKNTDIGEACDVQHSRLVFRARAIDTAADQAANILELTGSINANVSLNDGPDYGIYVLAEHYNGRVLDGISCDNNRIWVIGARAAGGTGEQIRMRGITATHPVGGDANVFEYISGVGAVIAEGTGTAGVTQGVTNRIIMYDTANATPAPVTGVGCNWNFMGSDNVEFGGRKGPTGFGDSAANAKAAVAAMGLETIRIRNGNSNHLVLEDPSGNVWIVNIDGATGNLRFTRGAGTGAVAIAGLILTGQAVTFGANNSGGAGFRQVIVPN